MYLFDARRLRDDLVHDRVATADFAIYAFLMAGVGIPIWITQHPEETFQLSASVEYGSPIVQLIVTGLGTRACYKANGGADGRDFLNRFISLAWIIGVRVSVFGVIPLAAISIFMQEGFSPAIAEAGPKLAMLVLAVIYYRLLSTQLRLTHSLGVPTA